MTKQTLIICYSYHHNNTLKIANTFAKILNAKVITPKEIDTVTLDKYDLIGFGAGIDSEKHYQPLLSLAKSLSFKNNGQCFIFSTSALQGKRKVVKDHKTLRTLLTAKGYRVLDEFSCKGFNTNSFLKYVGGMNKGRPNLDDVKDAELFAKKLKQRI